MKVRLDEGMPHKLRHELVNHDVETVTHAGFSSLRNGVLLDLAVRDGFQVMITNDRRIPYQHNVPSLGIAPIVLAVRYRRSDTILPLVPEILAVLDTEPAPGTLTGVGTHRT